MAHLLFLVDVLLIPRPVKRYAIDADDLWCGPVTASSA
jgi:hypothetical protein